MSELVLLSRDADVAILTINHPPVNAMSAAVVVALEAAMQQALADTDVGAIVIVGGGRTFIAGADITEFLRIVAGDIEITDPTPLQFLVEDSPKPVVMAIHGTAFGAGLELALGGHYRVASPSALVGLPEVKLGLIPGGGGTQRLPRLSGVMKALEMAAGGSPVKAADALATGILDQIVEGDLLAGAVAFAREAMGKPTRKTRELTDKLGTSQENAMLFAGARHMAASKAPGFEAPLAVIAAIEAATTGSFEAGSERERTIFLERLFSAQSKALIHLFFSEREIAKLPDIPKDTPVLPIASAAVVGAGTMGAGIAMSLAEAGIPVLLKDTTQEALDRGLATIGSLYEHQAKTGRIAPAAIAQRLALITPTLSYESFAAVDIVIEAVFEGMALKQEIFRELDRVCRPGAILASNTSTLDIDQIASAVSRPEAVVGTHFFTPPNIIRLLEIVRGRATSRSVLATCMQLAKRLGKLGAVVGNCKGFVANRMFLPYHQQAEFLVEEGAPVVLVDQTLTAFGMGLGPLLVMDMVGLDVGWRIREAHKHLEDAASRKPFLEDRLAHAGRHGRKTGAGWYLYDERKRARPDPDLEPTLRAWTAEAGMAQRDISSEEIIERCIYSLINEGARIYDEKIVPRMSDVDTIFVHGFGFPAWRGGPMWYADSIGLDKVYARVVEFHQRFGDPWQPAPLLERLAGEGGSFYAHAKEAGR